MPEIFFPSQNISSQQIFGKDAPLINILAQNNAFSCNELTANMPYCLAEMNSPESKIITQTLGHIPEASRQNLMCTIDTFGDFTATLAAFYDNNLKFLDLQTTGSLLGAGATASEVRLNGFQKALVAYQDALVALNNHKGVGRGPSAARIEKKTEFVWPMANCKRNIKQSLKKLPRPTVWGKTGVML